MYKPELFKMALKKEFKKEEVFKDIIAGIIVAIIALPLSIALGISSGVSPEKGIITAIIAGFCISFFGGSRVQIGGPTGAFVVIIYGIIEKYGLQGLIMATIMAGIFLILMGIFKLGNLIKYIPCTITVGFTSGIGVVLFSGQIKDFLGLNINEVPSEFIPKWQSYISHFSTMSYETVLVGIASVLIIIYWNKLKKISQVVPSSLVAILAATFVVNIFNLPVETIGDRYSSIASSLPKPSLHLLPLNDMLKLVQPAMVIAILAAIESLLSAVVSDSMIGEKHDSNAELIGQGIANIFSGLFGGIPATGAIARTAANVKNGGRSPIAGIVHAITLFFIMKMFMPFAKLIPMTTLGSILMVVSYNMIEFKEFKNLLKAPKSDIIVLISTFILTIVFDLVVAIEVGMLLSMILFVRKMASSAKFDSVSKLENGTYVYDIEGALFFGVCEEFKDIKQNINKDHHSVILRLRNVSMIDASAVEVLKSLHEYCQKEGKHLIICEAKNHHIKVMKKMGFVHASKDMIFENFDDAVNHSAVHFKNKKMQYA